MKSGLNVLATLAGIGALALLVLWAVGTSTATDAGPEAVATTGPAAEAPGMATLTFHVEGMTCAGCVLGTRRVLERLEGVEKADVSYEESQATVTYDPSRVDVERMAEAVATLGYEATVVERPSR